jgi:hypothetical protein
VKLLGQIRRAAGQTEHTKRLGNLSTDKIAGAEEKKVRVVTRGTLAKSFVFINIRILEGPGLEARAVVLVEENGPF